MNAPGPLGHIALVVRDAARTAQFLADLFGEGVRVRHDAGGPHETCEAENKSLMPALVARTRPLCVANARHSTGYGCALRLDWTNSDAPFGRDQFILNLCVRLGDVLLVLAEADVERPLLGDHLAFTVSPDRLRAYAARLAELGHVHQMARHDTALYFADFDHHVFELECVGMSAGPAA